jgi:hypothetical protein
MPGLQRLRGLISSGDREAAPEPATGEASMTAAALRIVFSALVLACALSLAPGVTGGEATIPDAVAAYNHLPTGKEPMSPAGPLPASGWSPAANDTLNVRELGARGDGVTDDTKVLQGIFANVDHGQVIFFPAGKYLISDTLKLNYRFGVRIVMHGGFRSSSKRTADCRGLFWDSSGPQDRPMMLVYDCSQIVFDGLKLDGGGRAQDGLILDAFSSSSGFRGDNVHVRSCARYGLRIATWREGHPAGGPQVDVIAFRNSKFTNCGSKEGTDDAQMTVESAQALIILFDTCEFTCGEYGEYGVYIRGGKPYLLNACFLGGQKAIYIGNNYTAGVSVYMAHSEGLVPGGYFLYVDRPQPGGVTWATLENIGAAGKVFWNVPESLQISNSALYGIEVPCPEAKVVLTNVRVQGQVTLGTRHVTQTNVTVLGQ